MRGVGPRAEQPVQGHGVQPGEPLLVDGRRAVPTSPRTACCSRAAALPVGAARAMRSGGSPAVAACSASSASSAATVVVLPVPGPPVSTVVRWARATGAAARCSSYPAAGKTRPARRRGRPAPRRPAARSARPAEQVGADLHLLAPVAVEVEQPRRARAAAPAGFRPAGWRATAARPRRGVGPGQVVDAGVRRPTVRQVDADRAAADRAHGDGDRQGHRLVRLVGQRVSRLRDVDVDGVDDAGAVELAQQPGAPRARAGRRRGPRSRGSS